MEQVAKVRDQELGVIRSAALLTAANMSLMSAAPVLVAIAALFAFAADDGEFTASRVFSALTLFGQLRFPLMMYVNGALLPDRAEWRLRCLCFVCC